MAKPLVIVESPAKARTIAGYLGADYKVLASVGHIRDLPGSKDEVPDDKKETHGRLAGIDPDNHFDPVYIVHASKKKVVAELKAALKGADELILATDEDREGEAIGWHVLEVLQPKVPVRRMVFHEITPAAIREALDHPRELDMKLVEAQEGRRILDRLVGWETSPVLWRVFGRGQAASAGRVQSVAVRMVVQRERARMAFRAGQWSDLEAELSAHDQSFKAGLVELDDRRLAEGRDFDSATGQIAADKNGARRVTLCSSTPKPRPVSPIASGTRRSRSLPSSPIRSPSARGHRSLRPRSSRSRAASCVSVRPARCRSRNVCTSVGTSPTCVPTAPTSRSRR